MIDVFQTRALVKVLDHIQSDPNPEVQAIRQVFELDDVSLDVSSTLREAFVHRINGRLDRGQQFMLEAFWLNYVQHENYDGDARCFVNPPTCLKPVGNDLVVFKTHDMTSRFGRVIDSRTTQLEKSLTLSSMGGEEKGFFKEIIFFCGGLTTKEVYPMAKIFGDHILPDSTAFIFEVPNSENGLWLSLFDLFPKDDVTLVLNEFMAASSLNFEQIDVKTQGPRTTLYFGVRP